jgi:non-ribosomal peptide synthetase component F
VALIAKSDVLDPKQLRQQSQNLGVTTLFLTTALFHECARGYAGTFSGIEQVLFGGE